MAETTIGNLTLGAVDGTSMFEQERTVNGSQVSEKILSSSVANFIGTSHQFAGLSTDAKNLVGAINEAASTGGVVQLTQAEYDILTSVQKMNGSIYKITDNAKMYCLDKAYHPVEECTVAEYNQKTSAQQNNGTIYIKTDAETTGSDIPVATGETETIAEAIEAIPSITYEDVSGTTGTTQYAGYYYVDVTKTEIGYIVGAFVIDSTSNRLAFCQRISATKVRVYSPVAETTVTVRVLLSN